MVVAATCRIITSLRRELPKEYIPNCVRYDRIGTEPIRFVLALLWYSRFTMPYSVTRDNPTKFCMIVVKADFRMMTGTILELSSAEENERTIHFPSINSHFEHFEWRACSVVERRVPGSKPDLGQKVTFCLYIYLKTWLN